MISGRSAILQRRVCSVHVDTGLLQDDGDGVKRSKS